MIAWSSGTWAWWVVMMIVGSVLVVLLEPAWMWLVRWLRELPRRFGDAMYVEPDDGTEVFER